ncbi:MAG: hypothetical protein R3237_02440 [Nitrosopumilaceae archaeon]|nr:hypothetical protein [Nitrosopumilaceae archaeon]
MKTGPAIITVGIVMILSGAILFYWIQGEGNVGDELRLIKHGGTFVGLMGIGVVMAGVLLYLIARGEPPIQEDFEPKDNEDF